MRKSYVLLALLTVLAVVLASCQATTPVPTEEPVPPTEVPPTPEPTEIPLGSEERPIKVLFVPSVDANVIVSGGELLAAALKEATGLNYVVSVPTSYAATVEEMCASPDDTMSFLPTLAYVLANQLCGVDVSLKAIRRGNSVYWAQFLVRRDSGIETFADLEGKKWAYPDQGSASGYLTPLGMYIKEGVTSGESVAAGGHPQAVLAVVNGEADVATSFYSPPGRPEGEPKWEYGQDPDIPADLVDSCAPVTEGETTKLMCGGWEVLDARRNIAKDVPDVVQQVKILTLTTSIPNDTLSFGPDFPMELRTEIISALQAFAETDAWANSLGSQDFYGWDGMDVATDADYDVIRAAAAELGLTLDVLPKPK